MSRSCDHVYPVRSKSHGPLPGNPEPSDREETQCVQVVKFFSKSRRQLWRLRQPSSRAAGEGSRRLPRCLATNNSLFLQFDLNLSQSRCGLNRQNPVGKHKASSWQLRFGGDI